MAPRWSSRWGSLQCWVKTVGAMTQTLYRGIERVRARFTLAMAACNLARLPKLLAG